MKDSISHKLAAGFGLCLLLMVAIVWFDFAALQKLEKLYQGALKRSMDVELAIDARHIGEDLHLIIAGGAFERDLARMEREWAARKTESLAKLRHVAGVADTPEEHEKISEAGESIDDIIRIFEQEMLPLIRLGTVDARQLAVLDVRIDKRVEVINLALQRVAESMTNENQEAGRKFHAVLVRTGSIGLIISLGGVLAVIVIMALASRKIVRPLAELTDAALEMKNGNFLVELKHQSGDEIGVLTAAFRDMSGQVERRTAELQEMNEHLQREIGERRLAEEEIRRLNAELDQRVEERTAELLVMTEQLRRTITAQKHAEAGLRSSQEQLRNLTTRLQSLREEERTRISREIHDELGQALTALKLDVSWLGKNLSKDQAVLSGKTCSMKSLIDTIIRAVQRISAELRPAMLDDLGLVEAIKWQAKEFQNRTGIACVCAFDPADLTVDLERSTAVFRIFQETLTNIARHADASEVCVTLEAKGNLLTLTVRDNGRGISGMELSDSKSLGLIGIRERARHLGGEMEINGFPGEGTVVKVVIRLDEKEETDDKSAHC